MPVLYEKENRNGKGCLQACGYSGTVRDLVIPEEVDGSPVLGIAGHAFENRKDLYSVTLPRNLKTMRSFAFYGCTSLRLIDLFNTTDDYYDGVIRQCRALRRITVHCVIPDNFIIVREMLRDVDVTLHFRLFTPEGELRLTFPEYVSEAREDTMARAIHFSIEGAGMAYRECVGKKSLDLWGYDRLLGRLTDYDFEVAAEIALGRLSCPVGLSFEAEKGYEEFLRSHGGKALEMLIRKDETESRVGDIKMMADRGLIGNDALEMALEQASRGGRVQAGAVLMEYRRKKGAVRSTQSFSLDW